MGLRVFRIATFLNLALMPGSVLAQINVVPGLPTGTNLAAYVQTSLVDTLVFASGGILLGMLIFYALQLAVSSDDESTVGEVRSAYLHAFFGAVLITGSAAIATSVNPIVPLLNSTPIIGVIINVTSFFLGLLAVGILVNLVHNGAKLITAFDDKTEEVRKGLMRGFIGLSMVLLAQTVVNAVNGGGDPGPIITEIKGIGNFLITILGALAVIGVVGAGVLMVISVDPNAQDRAKKIVIASVFGLLAAIAAGGILNAFT